MVSVVCAQHMYPQLLRCNAPHLSRQMLFDVTMVVFAETTMARLWYRLFTYFKVCAQNCRLQRVDGWPLPQRL